MSAVFPNSVSTYLVKTTIGWTSEDSPFSLVAWVKAKVSIAKRGVMAVSSAAGGTAKGLLYGDGVGGKVAVIADTTTLQHTDDAELEVWHHVAGVFVDDDEWRVYVDGVEVLANPTQPHKRGLTYSRVGIYNQNSGTGYPFYGLIAEATFYDAALSAANVATLAGGEWAGNVAAGSILAHLPLVANPNDAINANHFTNIGGVQFNRKDHPVIYNAPDGTYPNLRVRLDKKSHKWQCV